MAEDRRCEFRGCQKPLERNPGESDWAWGRRRYCDRARINRARAARNGYAVWTVGMIAATREMVHRGLSAQQVADGLKRLGYPPVSRNAVIGIINRRNLRDRAEPEPKPEPPSVVDKTLRQLETDAARDKPPFACATPSCRNTKQPGRDQCASCIGARLTEERARAKENEPPYMRVG